MTPHPVIARRAAVDSFEEDRIVEFMRPIVARVQFLVHAPEDRLIYSGEQLERECMSHLGDNASMSVSVATVRTHIDYHAWATRRLMDAVGEFSHEELGPRRSGRAVCRAPPDFFSTER